MYEISVFSQPLGMGQIANREDAVNGSFASHEEAREWIEQQVAAFELHGRNDERDYWWCRTAGAKANTVFRIDSTMSEIVSGTAAILSPKRWTK